MASEDDTRAKYIDPKLHESGWKEEYIQRGKRIAPGRIIDEQGNRKKGTEIDYILHYHSVPIAVVEAKKEYKTALDGMQQAKDDAKNYLDVPFAYSSNGKEIEEFNFFTNKQSTLERFPSPEELWQKFTDKFNLYNIEKSPLDYPYYYLSGGKYPRYYQEVAIKKVIEKVMEGKKRLLLTLATGTGKTYIALQIAWKLVKSGHLHRVLYLSDRIFLRDQAYNEFSPFADARDVIEEGQVKTTRDIFFSMYQSMYSGEENNRLFQKYPRDFFDLVIIDECHRSGYGTWKQILDYFTDAIHLGMTATPKRDDNIDTYAYFHEPVYTYSMGKAIEDGFLAPFQIFRIFTNIDKEGLHIQDALYQGAQIYVPEEVNLKEIYTLEDFERQIILPDRTAKICEHLANLFRAFGPKQRSIVFCVNMDHAALVAKELQNRFSDLGFSDYAVRIVSEEPEAKEIYEQFRDSDKTNPIVATTVDLLTTGIDVPSVHNIILLRPIASKVVFKQIIGRGSRIDPITNKYFFRIIDYVNATRLLDDWDYPASIEPGKVVEGPFDITINGIIVHYESQSPIENVRIMAQIGPNMQRICTTGADGRFILTNIPHSPITLHISMSGFCNRELTIDPTQGNYIIIELKPELPVEKKIILKGIEVYIANELRVVLTSNGKTLSEAEYVAYSKDGIIQQVSSLENLRDIWLDSKEREKLLKELRDQSIYPELIANLLQRPDVDSFDILAHIAFGIPMLTRDERAEAFKNLSGKFIEKLNPKAQEILISLLDKYRLGGVSEISKPELFRIPPFDRFGYVNGVAQAFGGFNNLKNAIEEIRKGLYSIES